MELKDRVVVIDEKNMAGLSCLYGEMNIDELGQIVNKHLSVCSVSYYTSPSPRD